ncbi:hypothetical protein [Aneurinibacillus migulanus]|uniref:hypothetical protein n=1 Tax=Aneurinibacillus migulanus TaxID=47500 RepID=UPI001F47901F|nr:hypothetical protein [Aneurinibacillus migulanus]
MIHRQMFMVGGKKRRRDGGWARSEKDTFAFLLPERRAHPTSSFFRISSFQPHSPVEISNHTKGHIDIKSIRPVFTYHIV